MSCMIGSQGLVLATAMVVSSTFLFLTFSRQKAFFQQLSEDDQYRHHNHNRNHHRDSQELQNRTPRSCLYSGDKNKKVKKRVRFAESVKEPSGNGKEFRNQQRNRRNRNCRNEVQRMPRNHIALYNGILKNRFHTIECSY